MRARALVASVVLIAGLIAGVTGVTSAGAQTTSAVGDPVASAGCGSSSVAPGGQQVFLTSGGEERWYFRNVPPAHDGSAPVPVVFDYHGLSEGATIHQIHSQFAPYGDANGFVTIFPQARGTGLQVSWDSSLTGVDVAMFGDILDQVEADLCVDTSRVFVTGLSQGAFMTSAIACVFADRVAAIAPVAGLRNPTGCSPSRPVPVRAFHGTADTWVSFSPVPGNLAGWAARNGCEAGAPTEELVGADDVVQVHLVEHDCPVDVPTELYRVTNGGHTWPGSVFSQSIETVVGYTTFVISATELAWEFFESHPMGGVTYTARYPARSEATFAALAAGLGASGPGEIVGWGVTGLRALAEAGQATPIVPTPTNAGPYHIATTYAAEDAEAIEDAAAAWGVDGSTLHRLGGTLVAVMVYLAAFGGG